MWHQFALDRALEAGPWFRYFQLYGADARLIDLRVHGPSQGHQECRHETQACSNLAPGLAAAGAVVDEQDKSFPPHNRKHGMPWMAPNDEHVPAGATNDEHRPQPQRMYIFHSQCMPRKYMSMHTRGEGTDSALISRVRGWPVMRSLKAQ